MACFAAFVGFIRDRLQLPNSPRSTVSVKDVLSKFRNFLDDDDCEVIGIYGMGGIGKTTLLQKIYDEFFQTKSGPFDLVIFVPLCENFPVYLIQKKILYRLGFDPVPSRPRDTIFNALRQKKFLLLLDNLWDEQNLVEIGIPVSPDSRKGSKIVFTMQSSEVCDDMDGARRKLEMPLLSTESSWQLFCQNLGMREDQWTESTRDLAKKVALQCKGLPLALITVARAMADVSDNRQWEAAVATLGGATGKLEDMEEEALRSLKFSYDNLREEHHKECLLYCSLFSENVDIKVSDLIEYWGGEGLLDEGDGPCSIDTARDRGLRVINALKAACFLQDGGRNERYVKLHDAVRQMALWITGVKCEEEEEEEKVFPVNSGDWLEPAPMPEKWIVSTRISHLWDTVNELHERLHCRNLRTLLLRGNYNLSKIPGGFFQYMPILSVLDLSRTGLKLLPAEINLLVELRLLDLSYTLLKSLPREVSGLTKLRRLNLSDTFYLKSIPRGAISSLSRLQSLSTFRAFYYWRGGWNDEGDNGAEGCVCLKDLAGLAQLEELGLTMIGNSQEDLWALLDCRRVCSAIRYLCLRRLENSSSLELCEFFGATKDMRKLIIEDCAHLNQLIFPENHLAKLKKLSLWLLPLETIYWKNGNELGRQPTNGTSFKNLLSLRIWRCWALEEITWTKELPCLENLDLMDCSKMVEMIVLNESVMKGIDQARDSFFPKLKRIELWGLRNLKNICGQPLLFPALEYVVVGDCPNLKKLPFGPNSGKSIKTIVGDERWGNDLEWDNEVIRSKFIPYHKNVIQ